MKLELPPVLSSYPRLASRIFIVVLHTVAEVSSIIFYLNWQFFADAKIFELERLSLALETRTVNYAINYENQSIKLKDLS